MAHVFYLQRPKVIIENLVENSIAIYESKKSDVFGFKRQKNGRNLFQPQF